MEEEILLELEVMKGDLSAWCPEYAERIKSRIDQAKEKIAQI